MSYQLTCPKCKHEFQYDNGYVDKNITRLGHEIQDINLQLAEHRLLPFNEQRARTDWWLRAKRSLAEKQKELGELKAIRKVADQQINAYEYMIFKAILKDMIGQEEYQKILERVLDEVKAYKESGLMRHEYTRSNSKSGVTNINKL